MTILEELKLAKQFSDQKEYLNKNIILTKLMKQYPKDFYVNSDYNKTFVGIVHLPTGFKFHIPRYLLQ